MRADEHLAGSDRGQRLGEGIAEAVRKVVVGHHALDPGDAVLGKEGGRAGEKARAGLPTLIGVDLRVGEASPVIDRRVHVVKALAASCGRLRAASVDAPSPSRRDPPEAFHIDVHKLAGALALIAHRAHRPGSHRLAGEGIEPAQRRKACAHDHATDRPGAHPELGRDPVLAAPGRAAKLDDRPLELARDATRARARTAGAIPKAGLALQAMAPKSFVDRRS